MKQAIIFILAFCTAIPGFSQKEVVSKIVIQTVHNMEVLTFTVSSNVNVRQYRIEAGHEPRHLEVIATIASTCNSLAPVQYSYALAGHDYTYYRVAKVEMNGGMPYSEVISRSVDAPSKSRRGNDIPASSQDSPLATIDGN